MTSIASLNQHVTALLASTFGFAMGVTLGWSSLSGLALRVAVGWDSNDVSFVISIVSAAASVGSFILPVILIIKHLLPCRFFNNTNGVLIFTTIPLLIAGWIIVYLADYSYWLLVLGRTLNGLSIGSACVLVPLYISEISSCDARDALLAYFHAMLTSGIVCSYGIATSSTFGDDVDILPLSFYSLNCALACLPALLCCIVPSSPFQLMVTPESGEDAAREALQRLHGRLEGQAGKEVLDREIERMRTLIVPRTKLKILRSNRFWRIFSIVTCIMICQQLSGASPIIFNALTIFDFTGKSRLISNQLSLVCGAVQIITSILAILLIKRFGRRILLTLSSVLMGIFLILLGWHIKLKETNSEFNNINSWMPPTWIALFFGSYNLGVGPISWSLLTDSFPMEIRYLSASAIAGIGWFLCLVVNFYLSTLLMNLGISETLWVFAVFCWISAIVAGMFIGETRGKTLTDIEEEFRLS